MARKYELLTLIVNKDYDKIVSLVRKGIDINTNIGRNTPLVIAIYTGDISIVELLLRNGANPQLPGTLNMAARYGHLEIAKLLVKYGAVADCMEEEKSVKGKCAIHFAAEEGHIHIVDYFLNKGADIDETCYLGTPLHCAVMGRKTDMMKHLIERGANINKENGNGRTALHTCVLNYDAIHTELLVQKGAEIKIFDRRDNQLNIILYYRNNIEVSESIAQILIKYSLLQREIPEFHFSDNSFSYLQKRSMFVNDCKTEIEKMKTISIGNTTVSLYTLLQDMFDDFTLVKRLKNKCVRDELENIEGLMEKYPIYSSIALMVKDKLANWNERQELLKTIYEIMNLKVSPLLPVEIKEKVFDYLTNHDLITFVNACKNCQYM